mgnify:CR=1 FL=1
MFNGILKAASAALSICPAANVRVVDGDTIVADVGLPAWTKVSMREYVRFTGVDAQPAGTQAGNDAAAWLVAKLGAKPVTLVIKNSRDPHGRLLAEVWLDGEQKSVNTQLVEAGHAVIYKDLEAANEIA